MCEITHSSWQKLFRAAELYIHYFFSRYYDFGYYGFRRMKRNLKKIKESLAIRSSKQGIWVILNASLAFFPHLISY